MNGKNDANDRIISDIREARQKFEFYERIYMRLTDSGKEYLRSHSKEYKKILSDIQEIILPSVKKVCPTCEMCCKLYTPDLSIYTAKMVGGFQFSDYMLIRCDTELPEPNYENAERNLCPFSDNGCRLPIDCRSYICIKHFCHKLEKELDMQTISEHLRKLGAIPYNISIQKLMF